MTINADLRRLADTYADKLAQRMNRRIAEMKADDNSHHLVYQVLGISSKEGKQIDMYQNKGRFLYRHAGSFLEDATKLCIRRRYPSSGTVKIPNVVGTRPKTFEIDCLIDERDAIEIKWRDATTDGDHIAKEHSRLQSTKKAGYTPIRIMYYYPNRDQAKKAQSVLETLYAGVGGQYYSGKQAWEFIRRYTGVNLHRILCTIAKERVE